MLEVTSIRKSFAGFVAVAGVSALACERAADRRRDRPQRRRQIDAVQPDHRPSAPGRRQRVASTAATSPASAPHEICRMGMGRSFQRTNIFPQAHRVRECAGRAIAHRGAARNFWSAPRCSIATRRALLPRSASPDRPIRVGGTLSLRQPEAARARPRAGQRPQAPAARRADRRHVGRARRTRRSGCWSASPRERELTLLFTEHDMEVVFAIAQKIAVLHQGRLIAEGTPAEVRSDPEVRRVYLGGSGMTRCSTSRTSTPPTAQRACCSASRSRSRRANASACSAATASARPRRCARSWG